MYLITAICNNGNNMINIRLLGTYYLYSYYDEIIYNIIFINRSNSYCNSKHISIKYK